MASFVDDSTKYPDEIVTIETHNASRLSAEVESFPYLEVTDIDFPQDHVDDGLVANPMPTEVSNERQNLLDQQNVSIQTDLISESEDSQPVQSQKEPKDKRTARSRKWAETKKRVEKQAEEDPLASFRARVETASIDTPLYTVYYNRAPDFITKLQTRCERFEAVEVKPKSKTGPLKLRKEIEVPEPKSGEVYTEFKHYPSIQDDEFGSSELATQNISRCEIVHAISDNVQGLLEYESFLETQAHQRQHEAAVATYFKDTDNSFDIEEEVEEEIKKGWAVKVYPSEISSIPVPVPVRPRPGDRRTFPDAKVQSILRLPDKDGGRVVFIPSGCGKTSFFREARKKKILVFESAHFPARYRTPSYLKRFASKGALILTNRLQDIDPRTTLVIIPTQRRFLACLCLRHKQSFNRSIDDACILMELRKLCRSVMYIPDGLYLSDILGKVLDLRESQESESDT